MAARIAEDDEIRKAEKRAAEDIRRRRREEALTESTEVIIQLSALENLI